MLSLKPENLEDNGKQGLIMRLSKLERICRDKFSIKAQVPVKLKFYDKMK